MKDLETKIWNELKDTNLYEPTKDVHVYEVNVLKESGEIEFSNTCNTLKSAILEYNSLNNVNKELLIHYLNDNGDDLFDEIASYFIVDKSGTQFIELKEGE